MIISFLLWLISILKTSILQFPPDTLFYLKQLPIYYWTGMLLNVIVFFLLLGISKESGGKLVLLDIFFLLIAVLYVFGTSCFVYNNIRTIDVYGVVDCINYINSTGFLANGKYFTQDFPLGSIYFISAINILGITSVSFAKNYPVYMMFVSLILIYSLSKRFSRDYAFVAPFAYLSCSFVQEFHLSPQSFAFLIVLTQFLLLLPLYKDRNNMVTKKTLFLFLYLILVMSHPSTPIFNLYCFLFISVIFIGLKNVSLKTNYLSASYFSEFSKVFFNYFFLFIIIYTGYICYNSHFMLNNIIVMFEKIIDNVLTDSMFVLSTASTVNPSSSYLFIYLLKWYQIVVAIVFSVSCIFVLFFEFKDKISTLLVSALFFGYTSLSFVLVILGSVYGTDRGFIFGYVFSTILFSMLFSTILKHKLHLYLKASVLFFIVFSFLITPLSIYGSDPYNFVSDSENAGIYFISQHPQTNISENNFLYPQMNHSPYTNYWYNLFELKQQKGAEYRYSFEKRGCVYDSSDFKIYTE